MIFGYIADFNEYHAASPLIAMPVAVMSFPFRILTAPQSTAFAAKNNFLRHVEFLPVEFFSSSAKLKQSGKNNKFRQR